MRMATAARKASVPGTGSEIRTGIAEIQNRPEPAIRQGEAAHGPMRNSRVYRGIGLRTHELEEGVPPPSSHTTVPAVPSATAQKENPSDRAGSSDDTRTLESEHHWEKTPFLGLVSASGMRDGVDRRRLGFPLAGLSDGWILQSWKLQVREFQTVGIHGGGSFWQGLPMMRIPVVIIRSGQRGPSDPSAEFADSCRLKTSLLLWRLPVPTFLHEPPWRHRYWHKSVRLSS